MSKIPCKIDFDGKSVKQAEIIGKSLDCLFANESAVSELVVSGEKKYRNGIVATLQQVLHGSQQFESEDSMRVCFDLAQNIEQMLFEKYFFNDIGRYASQANTLVHNLSQNASLLLENFTCDTLCSLPSNSLAVGTDLHKWRLQKLACKTRKRRSTSIASEEGKFESAKRTSKDHEDCQGRKDREEQGIFRCPKCKKRDTSYVSVQTRSADEPMTNFVTCHSCNIRFKR